MFSVAFASTDSVVNAIFNTIINPAINVLFIFAFFVFIWGVVLYIKGANNEEKRKKGKLNIIYGIVGFIVMFGAYSIIQIIVNTLDLDSPPGGPDYRNIERSANQ